MSIQQCPTCAGRGLISMGADTTQLGVGGTAVCPTCGGHGGQTATPGETGAQLTADELQSLQNNDPSATTFSDISASE